MPKHDSAKITIAEILQKLGACFCIQPFPPSVFGGTLGLPGVGLAGVPPVPEPAPGAGFAALFGVLLSFDFGVTWLGQTSDSAGAFSSVNSVLSAGFVATTWLSSAGLSQEVTTRPRRIAPCASWVEKIEAASWFAHEAQNRKPSSGPDGLKASSLNRAFTTRNVL